MVQSAKLPVCAHRGFFGEYSTGVNLINGLKEAVKNGIRCFDVDVVNNFGVLRVSHPSERVTDQFPSWKKFVGVLRALSMDTEGLFITVEPKHLNGKKMAEMLTEFSNRRGGNFAPGWMYDKVFMAFLEPDSARATLLAYEWQYAAFALPLRDESPSTLAELCLFGSEPPQLGKDCDTVFEAYSVIMPSAKFALKSWKNIQLTNSKAPPSDHLKSSIQHANWPYRTSERAVLVWTVDDAKTLQDLENLPCTPRTCVDAIISNKAELFQ